MRRASRGEAIESPRSSAATRAAGAVAAWQRISGGADARRVAAGARAWRRSSSASTDRLRPPVRFVAPQRYELGSSGIFGVGLGITAYTLGLRHAFDADHIGAIDNTTRKLMTDGQRPLSVGFFFSLGHSTIVFALGVLFVVGVGGLRRGRRRRLDAASATGLIGPIGLRVVPVLDRGPQPGRAGQHRADLPADARRPVRRGRARGAARQPRLHEPLLQAGHERGRQALADVSARLPVRARLRHRDRGRAARARRRRRRPAGCRSTRSSACRSCSPPGCRCSTRSTERS